MLNEAEEIAASVSDAVLDKIKSCEDARRVVLSWYPAGESPQIVDNIAWSLWVRAKHRKEIRHENHPPHHNN